MGIEIRIEIRRQSKRDRAVAGIDAPIALQHAAVEHLEANRPVAGPDVEGIEATRQLDRTIARIGVDTASGIGDGDRTITRTGVQTALNPTSSNAAVTAIQFNDASEVVRADRPVAGTRIY